MTDPTEWGRRVVMDTVYETLIWARAPLHNEPATLIPRLAKSFTIDKNSIWFHLNSNARFHDGKAITANDVQFSINLARTEFSPHQQALSPIISVKTIGKDKVVVHMKRVNGYVLRELAGVAILPRHIFKSRLNKQNRIDDWLAIGSGPYRIESHDSRETVLAINKEYWGTAPNIDRIVFRREPDHAEALRLAKEGVIDWLPTLIPAHVPNQINAPEFTGAFESMELKAAALRFIVVSHVEAPFDDVRVRQAISMMLNRDELAKQQSALSTPSVSLVWPGGLGDGPLESNREGDKERAYALLDEAGWSDLDGDGVRQRGSERLMITALVGHETDPQRDRILDQLRRAGFVVDVRVGSSEETKTRMRPGEFDLAFMEWRGQTDQDLSPLLETRGRLNHGGFSNPDVDQLLEKLRGAQTPAQRAVHIAKLSALLTRHIPVIPISREAPIGLLRRKISGARSWGGWVTLRELSIATR